MLNGTEADCQKKPLLYELLRNEQPATVLDECLAILAPYLEQQDAAQVVANFYFAVRLYKGEHPAYQACNTDYHDLSHATHTFLAFARLACGSCMCGERIDSRHLALGLTAAIFHDSGYLQDIDDQVGTGARYTMHHVERGVALLRRHFGDLGLQESDDSLMSSLLYATDLARTFSQIPFATPMATHLGRLLDSADLLAQMADRAYLERLLFLYHEFSEAGITAYASEHDLLRKTIAFYDMIETRLAPFAPACDRYLKTYFLHQCGVSFNPYRESIDNQREYLLQIRAYPDEHLRAALRRDGIVAELDRRYAIYSDQ